jgi:ribosomal protein S18 acetylase RimI-like enzyme
MLQLRLATGEDAAFLQHMLALAADWRQPRSRPVAAVLGELALARYVAGWPRAGDLGVVAVEDEPIGAAWWRLFTFEDPGYGFVDEATPEVSIGVLPEARGRGVGERLLRALITEAITRKLPALSLSVEPDNPARRLYERLGFRPITTTTGAWTMLLPLHAPPHETPPEHEHPS